MSAQWIVFKDVTPKDPHIVVIFTHHAHTWTNVRVNLRCQPLLSDWGLVRACVCAAPEHLRAYFQKVPQAFVLFVCCVTEDNDADCDCISSLCDSLCLRVAKKLQDASSRLLLAHLVTRSSPLRTRRACAPCRHCNRLACSCDTHLCNHVRRVSFINIAAYLHAVGLLRCLLIVSVSSILQIKFAKTLGFICWSVDRCLTSQWRIWVSFLNGEIMLLWFLLLFLFCHCSLIRVFFLCKTFATFLDFKSKVTSNSLNLYLAPSMAVISISM